MRGRSRTLAHPDLALGSREGPSTSCSVASSACSSASQGGSDSKKCHGHHETLVFVRRWQDKTSHTLLHLLLLQLLLLLLLNA